ncbi:arginine ABC transporter permease ArtQ, partial [Klebsiella pneumoniae]
MNEIFPLASAAGMTVGLAVCALVIGLVLAMLFALLESVKWRPIAWLATGIVTILRGLPEILVVLFIYFGSSQLLLTLSDGFTIPLGFTQIPVQMQIENFDVSPFLCGAIALSLLYAAYASQTLRGALKAVPQGQWESGQALGLSKAAIFFRLVMPQMWRHALPGLGNQWL